jgi:LiaI-LiaF-like transmembrane region
MKYRYNPSCSCPRCRAHGFMGPAVLITLGVLFLLDQVVHVYWMEFGRTWPALLIVIGLVMFLQHNAPATGHVPREYMIAPPVQPTAAPWQPQQQQQWHPPAAPAQPSATAAPFTGSEKPEEHNG